MKRIMTLVLALAMALSLAACGSKAENKKDNGGNADAEVNMTAQEIMDTLKEKLGDSFDCDTAEAEDRMSGYWGLDMDKVEDWAAMSNSNSSLNSSTAVILKVKDGYAQDAAALLQSGYEQMLSYARMYNMNLQQVLQARLFVNGNYVALLILGAQGDWEASDEEQAKFAADEAAKVDAVWSGIFGSADNTIVIPEDDGSNNGGFFDMTDDEIDSELPDNSDEPQSDKQQDTADTAKENKSNQQDDKTNSSTQNNTKKDDSKKTDAKTELSASDVLSNLKKSLGSSYTSDATESEARMSGYWGLDMSQVESWAAECSSNSSLNADCAIVVKVKDGYAASASAVLQKGYEQILSYSRMYDMDLQRALQARLFVSGNYVALLIEGQQPDSGASAEEQAKFAVGEAGKVDSAWKALFGSASNSIVIPAESESGGNGFDMGDDLEG